MALVPNILGTQPAGNLLAQLIDNNFLACAGLSGSTTPGHIATFADAFGTIIDGGSIPTTPAVVGAMRSLVGTKASSTSLNYTFDETIAETALGGAAYKASFPSSGSGLTLNGGITGAGGMDTGSQPTSGFLSAYLIYSPSTATWNLLGTTACQTSIYTGANAPVGYTVSALVGLWPCTTGPAFVAGTQYDRSFSYDVPVNIVSSGSMGSIGSQSISAGVPVAAKTASGLVGNTSSGGGVFVVAADANGLGAQVIAVLSVASATFYGFTGANPFVNMILATAQTLYIGANSISNGRLSITGFTF